MFAIDYLEGLDPINEEKTPENRKQDIAIFINGRNTDGTSTFDRHQLAKQLSREGSGADITLDRSMLDLFRKGIYRDQSGHLTHESQQFVLEQIRKMIAENNFDPDLFVAATGRFKNLIFIKPGTMVLTSYNVIRQEQHTDNSQISFHMKFADELKTTSRDPKDQAETSQYIDSVINNNPDSDGACRVITTGGFDTLRSGVQDPDCRNGYVFFQGANQKSTGVEQLVANYLARYKGEKLRIFSCGDQASRYAFESRMEDEIRHPSPPLLTK